MDLFTQNAQDRASNKLFTDILNGGHVLTNFSPALTNVQHFLDVFTFTYKHVSDKLLSLKNYRIHIK